MHSHCKRIAQASDDIDLEYEEEQEDICKSTDSTFTVLGELCNSKMKIDAVLIIRLREKSVGYILQRISRCPLCL